MAVAALALSACGGSSEGGDDQVGSEVDEPAANIELQFPTWQANEPGNADVFNAIIDEFEERNPGVTVNMYHVPNEDFIATILTQLQAGSPPDIIAAGSNQYAPFANTGLLEPLTERLTEAGILDAWGPGQDARIIDGEHYALELHGLIRMLHYNTDILTQAGIESPPSTPEELRAAAAAVRELNLPDVSAWGATTTTHPNLTGELTAFVLGMGGSFTKDGEWTLLDPKTVEAVELYRELASSAPPGLNGAQYRQLMAGQQVALAHDGNWVVSFFDDNAAPEVREDLQVAPSPFDHSVVLMGTGLGIAKDLPDERKELAWEFIQVAAEEEFQTMWAEFLNAPPGRQGAIPDELVAQQPALAAVQQALENAVSEWPDSTNYFLNFGEIDLAIQDSVMRMLTTDADTIEVLTDLEAQLSSITEP